MHGNEETGTHYYYFFNAHTHSGNSTHQVGNFIWEKLILKLPTYNRSKRLLVKMHRTTYYSENNFDVLHN